MTEPLRALAVAALALLLAGCETLSYYRQAVGGQLELLARARPSEEVASDASTPSELRAKLEVAAAIRAFASRELKLPDNNSYRRYADLGRPYVVWNVFAAPEFSTRAIESCFPVAGCVAYRGYFAEADAQRHATKQRAAGYDAHLVGVLAYSTLGWFDDPLLSTFIRAPDAEIARIVFHELAHQLVYVKGDTTFNESIATAIEREGVRRWLAAEQRGGELAAWLAARERRREFLALIESARERLDTVYASRLASQDMREEKRAAFAALKQDYAALKLRWGGFAGYDRILGAEPNNALLASVANYTRLVPAFERLLGEAGGDLERFYARVRGLAALPRAERCVSLAGC